MLYTKLMELTSLGFSQFVIEPDEEFASRLTTINPDTNESRVLKITSSYANMYQIITTSPMIHTDKNHKTFVFDVVMEDSRINISASQPTKVNNLLEEIVLFMHKEGFKVFYTTFETGSTVLVKKDAIRDYVYGNFRPLNEEDLIRIQDYFKLSHTEKNFTKEFTVFNLNWDIRVREGLNEIVSIELVNNNIRPKKILTSDTVRILSSMKKTHSRLIVINSEGDYLPWREVLEVLREDKPIRVGVRGYGVVPLESKNVYVEFIPSKVTLKEIQDMNLDFIVLKGLTDSDSILDIVELVQLGETVILDIPILGGLSSAVTILKYMCKTTLDVGLLTEYLSCIIYNKMLIENSEVNFKQQILLQSPKLSSLFHKEFVDENDIYQIMEEQSLGFTLRDNPKDSITPEKEFELLLRYAGDIGAHDISLSVGSRPRFRVGKNLVEDYSTVKLTPYMVRKLLQVIVQDNGRLISTFEKEGSLETSYAISGYQRYRVTAYYQRNSISLSVRVIPNKIMTLSECRVPNIVVERLKTTDRGLILITGGTGEGKSTTLSAIVDYYNKNYPFKIVTMEDPIEYLHKHDKAIVEQIEIGKDASTYAVAMKQSLRMDPDVIAVQECRQKEELDILLRAGASGHIGLASMHTGSVVETIDTILEMVKDNPNLLTLLSNILVMIISQKLIPSAQNPKKLVPIFEILINSTALKAKLRKKELAGLQSLLRQQGNIDFDMSIIDLFKTGQITKDTAMNYIHDVEELVRAEQIMSGSFAGFKRL